MRLVSKISQVRQVHQETGGTWGLVPTMGYLHEGHLSLTRRAIAENDLVAVSIFVNPTQFGPDEDLAQYPRDPDRDLDLLRREGVDLVFTPDVAEMYPAGFQTYVTVEAVTRTLEGAARPGHFRGVATVVCKLLNIFEADRVYFGQKDAQQVVVIKQMVRDLAIPVEIVVGETIREQDGLALSSRNAYLSAEERGSATVLYRALVAARGLWEGGAREGEILRGAMRAVVEREPRAKVDYISAADPNTLQEVERADARVLLSLAVIIGKTRLIDNFLLDP
jgi:pantoate--beta-alanine ligase